MKVVISRLPRKSSTALRSDSVFSGRVATRCFPRERVFGKLLRCKMGKATATVVDEGVVQACAEASRANKRNLCY